MILLIIMTIMIMLIILIPMIITIIIGISPRTSKIPIESSPWTSPRRTAARKTAVETFPATPSFHPLSMYTYIYIYIYRSLGVVSARIAQLSATPYEREILLRRRRRRLLIIMGDARGRVKVVANPGFGDELRVTVRVS